MRARSWSYVLAAGLLSVCAVASAQTTFIETPLYSRADHAIGSQYRADLQQVWRSLQERDTETALRILATVRDYCDAQQARDHRVISVAVKSEYERYMSAHADGVPTDWIDIACPVAYHMTGFVHAGSKAFDQALPWLDKAIALAPYYPDPVNERGFVLGQQGRLEEALASYRQAIALADTYPSAAYIKPLAMRGIGYVLIERGDLDGAQRAYETSLELDPGNQTALNELQFIQQQRAASDASTTTP